MHAMVVLRLIPDIDEEFELAEDGKGIDREWVGFKLNEFDDHALEEAVLLKEQYGAKVTAVALDGDGVDRVLQTALARGADAVLKIAHDCEGLIPASTTASLVAQAAKKQKADLILTGVQTIEDLFGQLAPSLGAALDWPQVSAVSGVSTKAGRVLVQQEYSGGVTATLSVLMPAVLGIQSASSPPRYVSGSKLRDVLSATIPEASFESTAVSTAPEIESVEFPEVASHADMIEGDAEEVAAKLVSILRERGFAKR
ncbi:Electron transfer flavoprotein subunit beta [Paraburkholderia sediminicola]|uniref:Electron transfer flavoprotein subunit beta n=1 Tax=Paraburkholderia sediminicola TaxID=458836 RepID=A0A6J5CWT2_9BURK|nr:electron transfer flavoprotein subunit beta/FixA family protein [Paraburkholderia sediminicola]CAB3745600.1 Electron transfer flavoprotein subunit beta [Paraburkholderia sediminicola]